MVLGKKIKKILLLLILIIVAVSNYVHATATPVVDYYYLLVENTKQEYNKRFGEIANVLANSINSGSLKNNTDFLNYLNSYPEMFVYSYFFESNNKDYIYIVCPTWVSPYSTTEEVTITIDKYNIPTSKETHESWAYFLEINKKDKNKCNFYYNGSFSWTIVGPTYANCSEIMKECKRLYTGEVTDFNRLLLNLSTVINQLESVNNSINDLKNYQNILKNQGETQISQNQEIIEKNQKQLEELEKVNNFLKEEYKENPANTIPGNDGVDGDLDVTSADIIGLLEKFKNSWDNGVDMTDQIGQLYCPGLSDDEKGVISLPVMGSILRLDPCPIANFINSQNWLRTIILLSWDCLVFFVIYKDARKIINDFKTGEVLNKTPKGEITEVML